MSSSRSDTQNDPLRPSDHVDGDAAIAQPALGFVGWVRWAWRQLTSMRTALVLLLLLAIAAVPGSLFPQRSADPNGVVQWQAENPDLVPILDAIQLFDVYSSAWFSAIYLLLFVSLIGCILPRTKHHWKALRSRPPRTPARLSRLADHRAETLEGVDAGEAVDLAARQLRAAGYRIERFDDERRGVRSVSAERGYLRETGNLLFHAALVGVLVSVGVGGGFAYTGQRVVVEGTTFVNTLLDYNSINRGRWVSENALTPYAMTLESFDVTYQPPGTNGQGQAGDFSANVLVRHPGEDEATPGAVRVNNPLRIAGDSIYLLGNGYAPTIEVTDAEGNVVFHDSVAFLPQDNNLTSQGVVKVTDGLPEQLGMVGFFYPTVAELTTGALTSQYPDLLNPYLTLQVYAGDLGIDGGTPRNVYTLDPTGMEPIAGGEAEAEAIELAPGESQELPNGWGTITFVDETPADHDPALGATESVKRFASLQIHHDASAVWVLVFALLALFGLLTALFIPRRRVWVKATTIGDTVTLEYAGLARGEDPALGAAVDQLAEKHLAALPR
ncbi:cytochrome c biogenesis protein ResB [Microbacterium sediminis]|uniref:Cytochrome C biogenesis protein n=1 Tax=Microbacterium sediminis TaxID=904291 RepID=A0A1B9NDA0_9MICO|nr:cytochrome c biogenesis protein ResB [Microbacterium sediminis]OCG74589.1 cytochrome C biogenesis protein [Microbacterium sediminis]